MTLLDRAVGSRHAEIGPVRLLHRNDPAGRHRGTVLSAAAPAPHAPVRARDLAAACSRLRCDGALYEVVDAAARSRTFCTRCGAASDRA